MNHERPGRPVCLPGGLETCPPIGLQGTHHPTRQDPGRRQGTQASDQGQKSCGMSETTKHRQGTARPALPGRVQPSGLAGGVKTTAASQGHRAWNHGGTRGHGGTWGSRQSLESWRNPGVMPGDGTAWGYGRDSRSQGSHVDTAARQDCGLPRRLWPMSVGYSAEPRWLPATNNLIATGP